MNNLVLSLDQMMALIHAGLKLTESCNFVWTLINNELLLTPFEEGNPTSVHALTFADCCELIVAKGYKVEISSNKLIVYKTDLMSGDVVRYEEFITDFDLMPSIFNIMLKLVEGGKL